MQLLTLLDRPIAFHRCFVTITGSVTGALFLSQLIYWCSRTKDTEGWFYKNREEWEEETGLSRFEQESARKTLRSLGILEEKQEGTNRTIWYRVNEDVLRSLVIPLQRRESSRWNGGNPADVLTETTTETTKKEDPPFKDPPANPSDGERSKDEARKEAEVYWEYFREEYPKRAGTQSWKQARMRFFQLVKRGVDPKVLVNAAVFYREAMERAKMVGTEFVQQASTFLGPQKETWRDYQQSEQG